MRALRHFFARWQNWLGLLLVALFVFVAIAAPLLSPQDPANPGPIKVVGRTNDYTPHPPSQIAPLGTLSRQISIYHALIWGTRSAVTFGLLVVLFAMILGVLIGSTSAYFGGFLNNFLMRITDGFLAFPIIAGVVLIKQIISILLYNAGVRYILGGLGMLLTTTSPFADIPKDLPAWLVGLIQVDPVLIAFILFSWMSYARIMNTTVMNVKNLEYFEASRALGASHFRIIFRHLLPNSIAPVIVLAAKDVGGMVLLQATFTFIGMGGDSPWGMLLAKGRDWIVSPGGIFTYWWVFLPATLTLLLFGIAWNLLGDGLNDALDPRLS